jgi:pimeloyl-ACP methyl ester carboxylesterase
VINGAKIAYEIEGAGPPVVFIHPGIADRRAFDPQVAQFRDSYRCIRHDMRGFGASQMPEGFYSHMEDLRVLMDTLKIERAHLVGISLGGSVALEFAIRYRFRPISLSLVGASVHGWRWGDAMEAYGKAEEALAAKHDLQGRVDLDMRTWVYGPTRGPGSIAPHLSLRIRSMVEGANRRAADQARGTHQRLDPPAVERLRVIRAPTMVIWGKDDFEEVPPVAEHLARTIRGARKAVIEDAAHLPNLERPQEFNRVLGQFLAGAGSAPLPTVGSSTH